MLRYGIETSLWGAYQLLAAYAITNEDREKCPDLEYFSENWAKEMRRTIDEHGFKREIIDVLLNNPVLTNTHAGFCLGVRSFEGQSITDILIAEQDLRTMLWHYGNGEGEEVPEDAPPSEVGASMLVRVGHSAELARVVGDHMAAEVSGAQLRRMVQRRQSPRDTYTCLNAKFKRVEAYLGVRAWVYDGKVDEDLPEEDASLIYSILRNQNYSEEDSTKGRWSAFRKE